MVLWRDLQREVLRLGMGGFGGGGVGRRGWQFFLTLVFAVTRYIEVARLRREFWHEIFLFELRMFLRKCSEIFPEIFKPLFLRSQPPFTGVVRGPGRKVPHGVLFECFWAPGSECPKKCFLSAFWHFLAQKSAKKHLKKHSLGHSEPGAQKHSKSTPWGTFRPGPLSTPVKSVWDRKNNLGVRKDPANFPPNFPPNFSANNKSHRRAAAGAQGERYMKRYEAADVLKGPKP